MKSLKNHLSLLLALSSILFSLQFYFSFDQMASRYERLLAGEYAIIVSSMQGITLAQMQELSPLVGTMEAIDATKVTESLKGDLTPENYQLLKLTMPKFYRIKLLHYPSTEELAWLESKLKSRPGVIKVETFARAQNKIFQLMSVVKYLLLVFAVMISLIGFLLMFKQMEVWRYEHRVRMNIMEIFGAPLWLRSAVLFRLATIDSLMSAFFVTSLFLFFQHNPTISTALAYIGLGKVIFDPLLDGLTLFGVAFAVSNVTVAAVILGHNDDA